MQSRKSQAAIILFAVEVGFFVAISKPAKKDCDIPIYKIGSRFTIGDEKYQ
jgi:hypothetical protein